MDKIALWLSIVSLIVPLVLSRFFPELNKDYNLLIIYLVIVIVILCYFVWTRNRKSKNTTLTEIPQQTQIIQNQINFNYNVITGNLPVKDGEAKELHGKEKFGYVKDNQVEEYKFIASPLESHHNLISKLADFIPENDLDNLITIAGIIRADKEGNGRLAENLHKNMVKRFGLRGRKIYDRLQPTEKLFEERLLPYLDKLKQQYGEKNHETKRTFSSFYEDFIERVSDAIWIGGQDEKKLLTDIEKRFHKDKLSVLSIFSSRSNRILMTENVCKELVSKNPEKYYYEIFDQPDIRGEPAKLFKIKRINGEVEN